MAGSPVKETAISYGRGGAGNMHRKSDRTSAAERLKHMTASSTAEVTDEAEYAVEAASSRSSEGVSDDSSEDSRSHRQDGTASTGSKDERGRRSRAGSLLGSIKEALAGKGGP